MAYHGDIRLGQTIDFKFTTRQISGAPFTLAGSPVLSAYVGNGTTEITAGITLTVDFDSRTGLNNVRVVASGGNGFATATDVDIVITTGTVNSVSVVGEVVGSFSIENRSALMPTTAARTLDVAATGEAEANLTQISGDAQSATDLKDFADAGYDPSTNKVQGVVLTDAVTVVNGLAADSVNASAVAGDAVTEIQNGLMTSAGYTAPDNAGISAIGVLSTAIKTVTDQFVFTVANQVDANALSGGGGLDAAGVRAAIGLAAADLDDQLDFINTNIDNFQNVTVIRNTTGVLKFPMFLAGTENPATGITVVGYRSLDGATSWTAVDGTFAEIADGWYNFSYAAADSDAREIAWRFTEATCKDTVIELYTSIA